jgi:glycosyltransferase involved in cell wall biosynthesis
LSGLVSVIIPCFQQGRFLRDAISSLQRQSYSDWEAIIVDDGSTDGTSQTAKDLRSADRRVKYIRKTNGGLSSARNAGLGVAVGAFIQFLDADDCLEPGKLKIQVEHLSKHDDIDIIYGPARYSLDASFARARGTISLEGPDRNVVEDHWKAPGSFVSKLIGENLLPVCAPLIRAYHVAKIGEFDESLRGHEDWDYWLRCAIQGLRFSFISEPNSAALIRIHGDSMTNDSDRMHRSQIDIRLLLHARLRDSQLRLLNLRNFLGLASVLPLDLRRESLARMRAQLNGTREFLLFGMSKAFDRGGRLAQLRTLVPGSVQRSLAKRIGRL